MRTTGRMRTVIMAVAVCMTVTTANAQRHHWHRHYYPHHVTVVAQPSVASLVSNNLNQKERLAMALAYLETNATLTVKKYANMTKLAKATAEAELDAFAADKGIPLQKAVKGKKKVYVKA